MDSGQIIHYMACDFMEFANDEFGAEEPPDMFSDPIVKVFGKSPIYEAKTGEAKVLTLPPFPDRCLPRGAYGYMLETN